MRIVYKGKININLLILSKTLINLKGTSCLYSYKQEAWAAVYSLIDVESGITQRKWEGAVGDTHRTITVWALCDPFALNGTERYRGRAAKVNDL